MGLRDDFAKILISEQDLQARIVELGQAINAVYTDDDKPLLVCILKGAFMFLADLVRHLEMRHEVDFMEISTTFSRKLSSLPSERNLTERSSSSR